LLANAVGLQRGYPLTQCVIWSLIVHTFCVGMHLVTLRVPALPLAEYSPVGAGLLANAVGLQRGYPLTQCVIWSLIVHTLCVGMHLVTLRVTPGPIG
jgi:hypothetical protein